MSSVSLPPADVCCGVCHATLRPENDVLVCEECCLRYDPDGLWEEARYLDEHATACGDLNHPSPRDDHRPFLTVSTVVKSWRTWHHRFSSCALPAGHTSNHHYPKTTTFTEEEASDA